MKLDFLERMAEKVASIPVPPPIEQIVLGKLMTESSVAVFPIAGGQETIFFNGARDKPYGVAISIKHEHDGICNDYLTEIYQTFERLKDLPSDNGSYEFVGIRTTNLPSKVDEDNKGFSIWEVTFEVIIHIYKGVD